MPALGQHNIQNAIAVEVANAGVDGGLRYRFERNRLELSNAGRRNYWEARRNLSGHWRRFQYNDSHE